MPIPDSQGFMLPLLQAVPRGYRPVPVGELLPWFPEPETPRFRRGHRRGRVVRGARPGTALA
jgi:hypothetical protein